MYIMKTLIKIVIIIACIVFTFSSNTTITKVREFSYEKGKVVYDWGVDKALSLTDNQESKEKISEIAK